MERHWPKLVRKAEHLSSVSPGRGYQLTKLETNDKQTHKQVEKVRNRMFQIDCSNTSDTPDKLVTLGTRKLTSIPATGMT